MNSMPIVPDRGPGPRPMPQSPAETPWADPGPSLPDIPQPDIPTPGIPVEAPGIPTAPAFPAH